MSNPLAVFRRHQKILLAVFGVALMIVFTVGGIVSQYMGSVQASSSNPVVVEMASGNLRESDIQNLRIARTYLRNFMQMVRMLAAEKGATPQQTLGIPDTDDESNLVQTAVLANEARELGIEVSDEAIIGFLYSYTEGTLEKGDFARILQNISQGRMTQNQFMDAMRREMLAMRFVGLFQRGMLPPTPTAAWEYFQRLNVRGTFEAVPFEAEDYLAKVSDPSDAEVRRVYEEGKDTYPLPDRPDPGFKRLKKVAVEYIEADLADFLPAAKAQITDEQVAAYYEANKGEFRNIELPGFDSLGTPGSGGAPTGDTQTPQTLDLPPLDLETPADPAVADPATLEPSSTDSSVSPESPPATTESGDADAILPPDDIQPLQDDPADEGPKQNTAPEDVVEVEPREGTETDTVPPEAKQPGASEAVAEENTAEAVADDQIPPAQDETEAEADAETEATDEPAADESATEPTEGTTPGSTEDPLGDLPDEPGNNQASERPEYMPLEQVADDIRTTLARPIARQNMDEALNAVRSAMRTYYGKYIAWEVAQDQTTEKTEPPATPDLRAIASQYGLKYGQTPLVDVLQLQETDLVTGEPLYQISRAYDMNFVSFAQQAFSDTLNVFEARSIRGQAVDSEYVYWKTAEEKEFVPELDQVRDEVVRTIKMREAIELAKTAATEAAAELRKSAQRPSEAYRNDANRKVLVADSVTWMVSSGLPYLPPQINQIPGIRFPGNSLMKAVFSLNPGEYGVGVDQPENTAYAVAMISIESDMDQLRQTFLRSGPTTETLLLAQQEGQKHLQNWFDDLEKRLNIKWQRDPAPDSRRQ